MKNIAFIVNPNSATKNKRHIVKQIDKLLDRNLWTANIVYTEYSGHATELALQYAQLGFDAVVAVGGDGTVSEVASGLRDTDTALGIIPVGSGNGLARHLNIPLRIQKAIEMLNNAEVITVDYGLVNDRPFFCTCGTGFDALISEDFAHASKRGLHTYIEKIVQDFFKYVPQHYTLTGENINLETDAFLITFANANQWGNSAYIAPKASVQDGLMDICIATDISLASTPALAVKLFNKTIDTSKHVTTIRTDKIHLKRENAGPFHADGDPIEIGTEIDIQIIHDGLKVLVQPQY